MLRIASVMLVFALMAIVQSAEAKDSKELAEIRAWCEELEGNTYWLRTDVIRVEGVLASTDATNVFPDGRVYFQGSISKGRQINAQTRSEFTSEARRKLGFDKEQNHATILTIDRGSQVFVHEVEVKEKQLKVKFTLRGNWYSQITSTIRLKFDKGYTLAEAQRSFAVAFAAEEYEVKHADRTDEIRAGMSMDQVAMSFGLPDKKISLDDRDLLVYNDLILVFRNDQLTDVK